ncbi:hypothetical protein BDW60DRAFT_212403 [Aspergillus nidulans var. acristatus]
MSMMRPSSEPAEEFAQVLLPLDHRTTYDDDDRHANSESDAEPPGPPSLELPKRQPYPSQEINNYFVWELITMVLSAAILTALVVVLARHDGKPQPDWPYISINSLISWMTTISRACILFAVSEALGQLKWVWFMQREQPVHDLRRFDEASRGPFGALELIWALRGRHFAALSSLAMILALGFEPFAQNLIRYYQGSIDHPAERAWTGNTTLYNEYGGPFEMGAFSVEPTLKSNVYNALFSNDGGIPWSIPRYICSSTNCTWDPVISLEARTLCANITDSLVQSCHNISETKMGRSVTALRVFRKFIAPWEFKDFSGASVTRQVSLWEAIECSIEPIVRSFQPLVKDSIYSDKTLAIWPSRTLVHRNDTDEITTGRRGGDSIEHTNDTEFRWQFRPPWGPELGMYANSTKTFLYGLAAEKAIAKFLRILFSGYYWRNQTHEGYQSTSPDAALYASSDVLQTLDRGDLAGCIGPVSYQLSVPARVNCSMQNVARAISKTFRDLDFEVPSDQFEPGPLAPAPGKVEVNVTFISVRWQWIALPVLVWGLGAGALAGAFCNDGHLTRQASTSSQIDNWPTRHQQSDEGNYITDSRPAEVRRRGTIIRAGDDGGICSMDRQTHGSDMGHPYLALLEAKKAFEQIWFDDRTEQRKPVVSNETLAQYLGEALISWKAARHFMNKEYVSPRSACA